ncbi:MAG: sodium:solute symporter [Firmicutes bacterium HGW-Firmicutes-14]|nr:MAG: sodium:solute symporter [Firmicutes bacterium HGW-Firmicutes-14]
MNEANQLNAAWYWIALLIYFAVVLYLGWRAFQKQKAITNEEEEHNDFWITGRSQPSYMVGMSIAAGWLLMGFMTWMSWATYEHGISGIWIAVIPWFILLFGMIFLTPRVRCLKAISQPQMLHNRFGLPARVLVSPMNIFCFIIWSAAELYAVSLIMAPSLGIPVSWMIVIFSLPVAIYMWMGGFRSVISANILQFFMAVIFMTVVAIASYVVARGIAAGQGTSVWAILQNQDLVNSFAYPLKEGAKASTLFGYISIAFPLVSIVALLPGWLIEEDWWLKAQSAMNTREARKGIFANLIYNVIWVLFCASFIGLMGLIIFPPELKDGVLGSAAILGDTGGYNVIATFVTEYMPGWAKVILIVLLSALSMSTVATFTNVCAMNLSYDILQPLWYRKKKWSDKKIISWSRGISMFIVLATIVIAELYENPNIGASLNDGYYLSSGVLTAGVAVPVFALFWKRANLRGVMFGGIAGGIGTLIFYILEYKVWEFSYNMPVFDWIFGPGALAGTYLGYCVVGVVAGIAGLIIGTYTAPPPSPELLAAVSEEPCDDHIEFFEGVRKTS